MQAAQLYSIIIRKIQMHFVTMKLHRTQKYLLMNKIFYEHAW